MEVQRLEYTTRGAVHCDGPCGCVIDGTTVEVRISFNGQHPASAYYCADCAPREPGTAPQAPSALAEDLRAIAELFAPGEES